MAILVNSEIGKIRGRIGNLVFKVKNGKQIISSAPHFYSVSNTPEAKSNRERFKACSKISSTLANDKNLKTLWAEHDKYDNRSAFQKISKYIYQYVNKKGELDGLVRITPDFGETAKIEELSIADDSIRIEIFPFEGNNCETAKYLCVSSFVFLYDGKEYLFVNGYHHINETKTEYNKEGSTSISIWFDEHLMERCRMYGRQQFLFQFYLMDESGKVVGYSDVVERVKE